MMIKMPKFLVLLSCLGLLVSGLSSCASTNRKAELEENMQGFVRALKRNDQMALLAFVSPKQQKEFYSNSKALDGMTIAEANIQTVFPSEDLLTAEMFLYLEIFTSGQMSVARHERQYLWKYDESIKAWFLSEKSPFGASASAKRALPTSPQNLNSQP